MGYTHYWTFKPKHGKAAAQEKAYQRAVKQCQKVISQYNKDIKAEDSKDYRRLSGYSAHCKVGQYGGVFFNGVGEESHEDFCLREHYKENGDFNFCKTARKPYDTVVVACLAVLNHYLKDGIEVSSDGDAVEWARGVELARSILKVKSIKNPIKPRLKIAESA